MSARAVPLAALLLMIIGATAAPGKDSGGPAPRPVPESTIAEYAYDSGSAGGHIEATASGVVRFGEERAPGDGGPEGSFRISRRALAHLRNLAQHVRGPDGSVTAGRAFGRADAQRLGVRDVRRVVHWRTHRDRRAGVPRSVRRLVGFLCELRGHRAGAARGC